MKPSSLLLRCYARRSEGVWVAVCIDLCLAAQADTFEEARAKLDAQIMDYVYDALAGEDRAHAEELLSRRAPLSQRLEYHGIRLVQSLAATLHLTLGLTKRAKGFKRPLPLTPQHA